MYITYSSLVRNSKNRTKTGKKALRVRRVCEILDEVTREGFAKGDFEKRLKGSGKTSLLEFWRENIPAQ